MAEPFDWGLLEPAGAVGVPAGDDRVLAAMIAVEEALAGAWDELEGSAAGPGYEPLAFDAAAIDRERLVAGAREAGVPVIALIEQLRTQAGAHAGRVHRGATSQDIVDSALVLVSRESLVRARDALAVAAAELAARAIRSRATPLLARTLTQQAEPTTLGASLASWLDAVVSALEVLDRLDYPVQLGGAVGTGAAFARLAASADAPQTLRAGVASRLGLSDPGRAWHTDRGPVLAIVDAAARVAAVAGRIGRDLGLAARDGVLLPATGGGSSAMPHKQNPVDAVLLTANGLRAPGLLATVHTAALSSDARPAGEWHAEWQAWRGLLRLAAESAEVLAHAVADLVVADTVLTSSPVTADAADLAAAGAVVDAAVARYRAHAEPDREADS
ncbi:lyase family protein [Leifsonia sp. NPDC056665]|uniref:lyase family protein n=1 Tax=Leifsonia sp. NPDC056665 TaxID=3345901 RepID=UPI0036BC1A3F